MSAAVGRADLVRLLARLPPEQAPMAAALLGFRERREQVFAPGLTRSAPPPAPLPTSVSSDRPMVPFWRLERMELTEPPAPGERRTRAARPAGLTPDDLASPGYTLFSTPRPAPLAPWSRLWPVLHHALRGSASGRDIDVARLVRAWARGCVVDRIPRVLRRAWTGRASVWVDRSSRLVPFWSDQADVTRRLRRVCGQGCVELRFFEDRAREVSRSRPRKARFRADPDTSVLVLGDLGTYGTVEDRAAWLAVARRLRHGGAPISALVPSSPGRWDVRLVRAWNGAPWEQGRRAGGAAGRLGRGALGERADRLLRLASAANLVQPGLLRALRHLLAPWEADAATEVDVWTHSDVRAADSTGLVLNAEAAERLRGQFSAQVEPGLKKQVIATIRDWHVGLPRELLRGETLLWQVLANGLVPEEDLDDARAFASRLAETMRKGEGPVSLPADLRRYGRHLLAGMPAAVYRAVPVLEKVWAAAFRDVPNVRVPEGIDPALLQDEIDEPEQPQWWAVRQVGSDLRFSRMSARGRRADDESEPWDSGFWDWQAAAWPSEEQGPGSPVAWMLAASPQVFVTRAGEDFQTKLLLEDGLCVPLTEGEGLVLASDRSTVEIGCWRREPWAVAAGRDRFGLWAEAEVKGVPLRFRWIPPGRSQRGSPETEAGRHHDEGPCHLVTWTEGRWLADVPVTQALWRAVMGGNPSRFVSPDRPVERVSWHDAQGFCRNLNRLVPALQARLPSEAEWEHACRAGTDTATWLGDLEILGEHNAPVLDTIAWYGGNCGVDFELDNGADLAGPGWQEKQYDHARGGTHPVKRKNPNPFGLHDMLGNVFEWCLDAWDGGAPYGARNVTDPVPGRRGGPRVFRGGSWDSFARYCRAALRDAYDPRNAFGNLGFRLVRGHAPGPRSGALGRVAERPENRVAGRGPVPAPARDAPAPTSSTPRARSARKKGGST